MKTIKDVAAYSGVSLTTVSRVVNGSDKVSPKTKAKVDQAIKELGYFPNNAARSLVKKQTDSIAIAAATVTLSVLLTAFFMFLPPQFRFRTSFS